MVTHLETPKTQPTEFVTHNEIWTTRIGGNCRVVGKSVFARNLLAGGLSVIVLTIFEVSFFLDDVFDRNHQITLSGQFSCSEKFGAPKKRTKI